MKIIIFRLFGRAYLGHEIFDDKFCPLMEFLSSDVGPYGESFKKFINDPNELEISSNFCCIAKKGNDVLIGCEFDVDPYTDCLKMSQKEFVSILDQWGKLVEKNLPEIILFKEGDSYRLEGSLEKVVDLKGAGKVFFKMREAALFIYELLCFRAYPKIRDIVKKSKTDDLKVLK